MQRPYLAAIAVALATPAGCMGSRDVDAQTESLAPVSAALTPVPAAAEAPAVTVGEVATGDLTQSVGAGQAVPTFRSRLVGADSSVVAGAVYEVASHQTKMFMDINHASQDDGAEAIQWFGNQANNQRWVLRDGGGGSYLVVNVNSGMCLDMTDFSHATGAFAQQWSCTGAANQRWRILPIGSTEAFEVVNVNSGMCLDLWGGSDAPAARLAQYWCWGGVNQLWDFNKISGADLGDPAEPSSTAAYASRAGVNTDAFGLGGTLQLNDLAVAQGGTGDCGAISGIISVAASQASTIERNIAYMGKDSNNVDVYQVQLFTDNSWKGITLDADIPTNQAQTRSGNSQIWGQLYEKALASVKGGYNNLNGINTTEVITLITGKPAQQLVGGGDAAVAAIKSARAVTGVGVHEGWYDPDTGESLGNAWRSGAVWLYDQHYYAVGGFTDAAQDHVFVINPWNQGPGDHGQMTMSVEAFKKAFWGYGVQSS